MKQLDKATGQFKNVYVKALDSLPVGIVLEFPTTDSSKLPNGYMFCDGSAISRVDYSELFGLIGTKFGVGDGSTTFNLPDKAGLVSVGIKSSDTDFDTIGETGGSKELQSHRHELYGSPNEGHIQGEGYVSAAVGNSAFNSTAHTSYSGTGNSGNLQPYTVTNYIIKVKQTRPLAGNIANAYSESQTSAYSSEYANKAFGGKILWTNPNPTANFDAQTITLNSDDYDMYEILCSPGSGTTSIKTYVSSGRIPKGKNYVCQYVNLSGNTLKSRTATYVSDTQLSFTTGYDSGVTNPNITQGIGHLVPQYVIGYKTGLF